MNSGSPGENHEDSWLLDFAITAGKTDQFANHESKLDFHCLGLLGEAGSVVSEFKKAVRDGLPMQNHRHRQIEELADFLWYFARIVHESDSSIFSLLDEQKAELNEREFDPELGSDFLLRCSKLAKAANNRCSKEIENEAIATWKIFTKICSLVDISPKAVAQLNVEKTIDIWPTQKIPHELFDAKFPDFEQIPRVLEIEFLRTTKDLNSSIVIRCNGINIGDRITDNIASKDWYRFHDVFHLSYATFLGWSPVLRSLLRCKRKGDPTVDENQDGARAIIMEEAVAASIFAYAKSLDFLEKSERIDIELLKLIRKLIRGYEVEAIPLWQWDEAILTGFKIFRALKANGSGTVSINLWNRRMTYKKDVQENHE
jgi:hypothetical protein